MDLAFLDENKASHETREHSVRDSSVFGLSSETAILNEWMAKRDGKVEQDPIKEVARVVSVSRGLGPEAAKYLMSSGRVVGKTGPFPSTVIYPCVPPCVHTTMRKRA